MKYNESLNLLSVINLHIIKNKNNFDVLKIFI